MGGCRSYVLPEQQTLDVQSTIEAPLKTVNTVAFITVSAEQSILADISRLKIPSLRHPRSTFSKSNFVVDRTADLSTLYQIDRMIGEGSFGKVRSATNRKTGERCAIKSIRYDNLSLEKVELLFKEVDILRELVRSRQDHPYIIKIYQVIHEPTHLHIVTELCTGGELLDLLIQGPFEEAQASEYMLQII